MNMKTLENNIKERNVFQFIWYSFSYTDDIPAQ